jgi:hypothetical protein
VSQRDAQRKRDADKHAIALSSTVLKGKEHLGDLLSTQISPIDETWK